MPKGKSFMDKGFIDLNQEGCSKTDTLCTVSDSGHNPYPLKGSYLKGILMSEEKLIKALSW